LPGHISKRNDKEREFLLNGRKRGLEKTRTEANANGSRLESSGVRHTLIKVSKGNQQETSLDQYHIAFLTGSAREFSAKIRKSIISEKRKLGLYKNTRENRAQLFLSRAIIHQLQYWLETKAASKRRLLNRTWNDAKQALSLFDATGRHLEYVRTFNRFAFAAAVGIQSEPKFSSRVNRSKEAVSIARRAAVLAVELTDSEEAAIAYAKTALFLDSCGDEVAEQGRRSEIDLEGLRFWKRALSKSRDAALLAVAGPPTGFYRILNEEEGLQVSKDALEIARRKGDVFAIGWLSDQMGARTYWKARRELDPRSAVEMAQEALSFAEEAAEKYQRLNFTGPNDGVLWAHSPYAEYFWLLAELSANLAHRRLLLEKSMSATPELLGLAKRSGYSEIMFYAHHIAGKTALGLAEVETRSRDKRKLLLLALNHRKMAIKAGRSHIPPDHWNRGLNLRYLADIQVKLSDIEEESSARHRLLMEAVKNKEEGLTISTEYLRSLAKEQSHLLRTPLGGYYRGYGDLLVKLFDLTRSQNWLRRAASAYSQASEWLKSTTMHGARAESYWKAGQSYMGLRAHSIASENFLLASQAYANAAEKTPHLKQLYRDYSAYMKAWSRIEKARDHHTRLEHYIAGGYYREAANYLRTTERWHPLAIHYSAMAGLESAENYSRNANSIEAIRAFEAAADDFRESKTSFQTMLTHLDQLSEREMINCLAEPHREEYCHARVMLEQAKMAENKGDYLTGSEKYRLAAERFTYVSKISKSEQERGEAEFLSRLAKAWQLSTRAQLNNSIELLRQARVFLQRAHEHAPDPNAAMLASAHEHFSEGLIATWQFATAMDSAFYESAASHFDMAANGYSEAGYITAADHAAARKLLLQASLHIISGNKLKDQKRKMAYYESAARLLGESVDAFERAGQLAKKQHTLGLLDKVKNEWELAAQLTEILNVATKTATNLAIPVPTHGAEIVAGLERFEKPDIEATIHTTSLNREDQMDLEIELINIGNQSIRLTKIDEVAPNWTEITSLSENWYLKGRSLETQPRRIDPMKMETVKLRLFYNSNQGLFKIRPRVTFIDEKGFPRSCVLRQKIIATSRIMNFLASAFSQDNGDRRLPLNHCGWRTLMEIVHAINVPRSHLYGEPRYGRPFGRQLDVLIKSSLVESRIFPGERGRGGDIAKVRIRYDNDDVKRFVEESVRKRRVPEITTNTLI
jgi:hypothetical protein